MAGLGSCRHVGAFGCSRGRMHLHANLCAAAAECPTEIRAGLCFEAARPLRHHGLVLLDGVVSTLPVINLMFPQFVSRILSSTQILQLHSTAALVCFCYSQTLCLHENIHEIRRSHSQQPLVVEEYRNAQQEETSLYI